jgi:hypothetical protein
MNIEATKIISIIESGSIPSIPYIHVSEWYSATWLCSHLRILSMCTWKDERVSLFDFICYSFMRDSYPGDYLPEKWLVDTIFENISKEDVVSFLVHSENDLVEAKKDSDFVAQDLELPVGKDNCQDVTEAYIIKWKGEDPRYRHKYKGPSNKHETGPTDFIFWACGEWFYMLEKHNES